jgi:5-methylcytosine-specific restriction protein A
MSKRQEFPDKVKVLAFDRAKGRCEVCSARLFVGKFQYDHIIPTAVGGPPTLENCRVACTACHGKKTATVDVPAIAKSERIKRKNIGAKTKSGRPMPGTKASGLRKRMDGSVERR